MFLRRIVQVGSAASSGIRLPLRLRRNIVEGHADHNQTVRHDLIRNVTCCHTGRVHSMATAFGDARPWNPSTLSRKTVMRWWKAVAALLCLAGALTIWTLNGPETESSDVSVGQLCGDIEGGNRCEKRASDAEGRGPMRPLEADPVLEPAGLEIQNAVNTPACVVKAASSDCYRSTTQHTATSDDVTQTRNALLNLGYSGDNDFEVRLAGPNDPAHAGAVLAGVRVDGMCILSSSTNFDQPGDLWAAGLLKDGSCLR